MQNIGGFVLRKLVCVGVVFMVTLVQAQQVPKGMGAEVVVVYKNWRGETAERTIKPIEIYWGSTEWHKQEQWLLKVWDIEKNAE